MLFNSGVCVQGVSISLSGLQTMIMYTHRTHTYIGKYTYSITILYYWLTHLGHRLLAHFIRQGRAVGALLARHKAVHGRLYLFNSTW